VRTGGFIQVDFDPIQEIKPKVGGGWALLHTTVLPQLTVHMYMMTCIA